MELTEAIYERRAVRDYTAEPVNGAALHALIDAAVQAPSGMNRQPWAFVVVEGARAVAGLGGAVKAHLLNGASQTPPLASLRPHLATGEFDIFYGAPMLIAICATAPDQMAVKDCCLAAQNLMLAARDRELGTCWIGFAESWLNTPAGKAALGVPEAFTVVAPIVVGHPASRPNAPPRSAPDVRRIR